MKQKVMQKEHKKLENEVLEMTSITEIKQIPDRWANSHLDTDKGSLVLRLYWRNSPNSFSRDSDGTCEQVWDAEGRMFTAGRDRLCGQPGGA